MELNTLKDRVKKFLVMERISNQDFAKLAGVSESYVAAIKKAINFKVLHVIYTINPRISLAWILWGEGEMYSNAQIELKQMQQTIAHQADKITDLQTIVELYKRNENAKLR